MKRNIKITKFVNKVDRSSVIILKNIGYSEMSPTQEEDPATHENELSTEIIK